MDKTLKTMNSDAINLSHSIVPVFTGLGLSYQIYKDCCYARQLKERFIKLLKVFKVFKKIKKLSKTSYSLVIMLLCCYVLQVRYNCIYSICTKYISELVFLIYTMKYRATPKDVWQWYEEKRITSLQEALRLVEDALLEEDFSKVSTVSLIYSQLARQQITPEQYGKELQRLSESNQNLVSDA